MLPNLVIIGAMKSATSSLHYYLDHHPQIFMSKIKELDFFLIEKNWNKGIEWYDSHFANDMQIAGESSPNYTKYPGFTGVPERMHSILPKAKLIYVLRDPIERIISHYIHNYTRRTENRTIDEALTNLENNHYLNCSKYYMQLQQYLPYYDINNILIVTAEDLNSQRKWTLQKIFKFLEVDHNFYCQNYSRVLHRSAEKKRENFFGHLLLSIPLTNKFKTHLPEPIAKACRFISGSKIEKPRVNEKLKQDLIHHLKDDVNSLRSISHLEFKSWRL